MNKSSFEEVLARDGRLIYANVGDSMWPFIRQGRDLLVIEPPKGRLKRLDVPLYRRETGKYVLHRVLAVKPDGYGIRAHRIMNQVLKLGGGTKGRLKYLKNRVFPPAESLECCYPFFYRHRAALPALYVWRIGKALTTRRKKVWLELKTFLKYRTK